MFSEDDLLPVSALQHLLFCARRAALVHIERIWEENPFTVKGAHAHRKVDIQTHTEQRGVIRVARALPLRSLRLGLAGQADVVEFHLLSADEAEGSLPGPVGVHLREIPGRWSVLPVEYKSGKLRRESGYLVQLCAQALCLEEMLGAPVASGAVYFGTTRRRLDVAFDQALRQKTEDAAAALHELVREGKTPWAEYGPKCVKCSMMDVCLPQIATGKSIAGRYLSRSLAGG